MPSEDRLEETMEASHPLGRVYFLLNCLDTNLLSDFSSCLASTLSASPTTHTFQGDRCLRPI